MSSSNIIVLTGASGVGKSTLLNTLKSRPALSSYSFYHFDEIGVPSVDEMIAEFGSPAAWQKAKTLEWFSILKQKEPPVILEGQMNIDFIMEGCVLNKIVDPQIILIDCQEDEMARRLIDERNQAELVHDDMFNWLKFLRNQALEKEIPILDTSYQAIDDSINQLIRLFLHKG